MVSHRAFLNTSFALSCSIWVLLKCTDTSKTSPRTMDRGGKSHFLPVHEYRPPVVSNYLYFLSLMITKPDKVEFDCSLRSNR